MKSLLVKIMMISPLFIAGLINGYAIVHDSGSALPSVNIYLYKSTDPDPKKAIQWAEERHKDFERDLGIPETVIKVSDKVVGITAPISVALAGPTEGVSLIVQQGAEYAVAGAKIAYPFLTKPVAELIGRGARGEKHAFHWDVFRGNRGRNAEWSTDNQMVAFITLPKSIVPIAKPQIIAPHGILGFTVKSFKDKDGKTEYVVEFGPQYAKEYIPAEQDTRKPIKKYEDLAQTSGAKAAQLPK